MKLREESTKETETFSGVITAAEGNLYESSFEPGTNIGFSDTKMELCNSVMVTLALNEDDLEDRVVELSDVDLRGYFNQSVNMVHKSIDEENCKNDPEEHQEKKNYSICLVTVNMSKEFFDQEHLPQTFQKDSKSKKYKSRRELKEDVERC